MIKYGISVYFYTNRMFYGENTLNSHFKVVLTDSHVLSADQHLNFCIGKHIISTQHVKVFWSSGFV